MSRNSKQKFELIDVKIDSRDASNIPTIFSKVKASCIVVPSGTLQQKGGAADQALPSKPLVIKRFDKVMWIIILYFGSLLVEVLVCKQCMFPIISGTVGLRCSSPHEKSAKLSIESWECRGGRG